MYTLHALKSAVRRSSMVAVAAAVVVSTVPSIVLAQANELNPLTERSLLLSSSAPGYKDTDGSGNSASSPNAIGENYAPPGSGPNGSKTGETFTFKVSTDSVATSRPIMAMTLQYCTSAAGNCQAPGDNTGDARTTSRETNAVAHPLGRSDLDVVFNSPLAGTDFEILVDGAPASTDWTATASNVEDNAHSGALTGKNNFITLVNSNAGISPLSNQQVEIRFNASETNYITNPGSGEFFVKINTYDAAGTYMPASDANVIDGGVTVANVMTDSIHITTKVLETMSFSVGTRNRDTQPVQCDPGETAIPVGCENDGAVHGTCDPIQQINNNRLNLGNPDAEFSLETDTAYDVYSYWRLSSNSSGGATVYYSGDTLRNTVGDKIEPIGATKATSTLGTEQFGLAFVDPEDTGMPYEDIYDQDFLDLIDNDRYRPPGLYTLNMDANYNSGNGEIGDPVTTPTAQFAFEEESNEEPVVIASDNDEVIQCSTAKMRYVANIGADTPAGVYTTKVNYLAAPQY